MRPLCETQDIPQNNSFSSTGSDMTTGPRSRAVRAGPFIPLKPVTRKNGKVIHHAWVSQGDYKREKPIASNTFSMEWPPASGKKPEFPEIDRAEFFDIPGAKRKVKAAQTTLIDELERVVAGRP
jgi:predicted NUDIX family NTP pyrophosphohydrolase